MDEALEIQCEQDSNNNIEMAEKPKKQTRFAIRTIPQENDECELTEVSIIEDDSIQEPSFVSFDDIALCRQDSQLSSAYDDDRTSVVEKARSITQSYKSQIDDDQVRKSLCERYHMKVMVTLLFLFLVGGLTSIFYFHERQVLYLSLSSIQFDQSTRALQMSNDDNELVLSGSLGRELPQTRPYDCSPEKEHGKKSDLCLQWQNSIELEMEIVEDNSELQCTEVRWSALSDEHLLTDCYKLTIGQWYGGGTLPQPVGKSVTGLSNKPLITKINSTDVLETYWFSTSGAAVYSRDLMGVLITNQSTICLSGVEQETFVSGRWLNYTICSSRKGMSIHRPSLNRYMGQSSARQYEFHKVMYSTHMLQDLTQSILLGNITALVTPCLLILDIRWQRYEGDLEFDKGRFENVTDLMHILSAHNISVLLEVSPYVDVRSDWFSSYGDGFFISEPFSLIPQLVSLPDNTDKLVALIQPANTSFMYLDTILTNIQHSYGVYGFSFKGGWADLIPSDTYSSVINSNLYTEDYVQFAGKFTEDTAPLFLQTAYNSLNTNPTIVLDMTSSDCNSASTLMKDFMSDMLALSITGYTRVAPTLMCGSSLTNQQFSQYIQIASLLPVFNLPLLNAEFSGIINDVLSVRYNLSSHYRDTSNNTLSLVQPVWYESAYIPDEFVVSNSLLVAPSFTVVRDVYLPSGDWLDMAGQSITGPVWMHNITCHDYLPLYYIKV